MKHAALLLILFAVCGSNAAQASDKWSNSDIALELSWQVLHWIDVGTTLDIVERKHEGYYERNWLYGGNDASRETVLLTGIAISLLHPVVTDFLPKHMSVFGIAFNPRLLWQAASITVTAFAVENNLSLGLTVNF